MAGIDYAPESGLYVVGEGGREIVGLPRGARVYNNPDTEAILAGAGRGGGPVNVINITQHFPPATNPTTVVRALNRWANTRGDTITTKATAL
jgi:hypothetical protein